MESSVNFDHDAVKTAPPVAIEPARAGEEPGEKLNTALMGITEAASEPHSLDQAEDALDTIWCLLEEARTAFSDWRPIRVKLSEVAEKLNEISDAAYVDSDDEPDDVETALGLIECTLIEARAILKG